MRQRFYLYQRRGTYYLQDSRTGKQQSLETQDRTAAHRILELKRQTAADPGYNQFILKTCLATQDPLLAKRTWQTVMDQIQTHGKESSRTRYVRAMKSKAFNPIRKIKLVETTADDLHRCLALGGSSTNHFLRCLHNLALGLGWLPATIIPPKLWPVPAHKPRRAITPQEHELILAAERNQERRDYYQLLWEIGAAQSDAAALTAEHIDWQNRVLTYQRQKTGEWASIQIGKRLESLLRRLPNKGFLFPRTSQISAGERSGDFWRRCKIAKVSGVSLHSYRYAWAQRARANGYPIRWAQNALGHNSRAVHLEYARGVVAVCPSLEDYETARVNPSRNVTPNVSETETEVASLHRSSL